MRPDAGGCIVMGEPESIPIRDLTTEPGSATEDAGGPSATERGIDFLAGIVSFGAGLVISALDGDEQDDRSAGVAAFVAAGARPFLAGPRAAAPLPRAVGRPAGPPSPPPG